ncbi:RecQ family helicase RecQ, putative [Talaromyces stipitatus ATCC 10500]|uniref:ATP-dependent DNA helicase n=1 Tax=Talaromyces stipitatus (strain ATCC 10500 / CBS 375.48 / QM 6759 / NRRL 1006) TaxID=441959 RepID=B8LTV9_TALSN|nr:RecQ family helicase RecQ, putative [Talaromyces stipitatus ATCC 10500]EED23789.1 RecQ family helicase RecQ, putative [Talaromyces stipitatus ATCC 10500]
MVNDHNHLWVDIDFTLRRVFGKTSFRPLQREVISAVIDGHDVFLQAATSFGKSLCFQLPAVVSHGVTLVVSPLLSLMVDQVAALEAYGIPVATINGTTPLSERKAIIEDILSGHPKIRLLYVTPEFCCTETFRRNLKRIHAQGELTRVAIDEAHCISEWGHDFRPAYKELSWFRETFKNPLVPITALTATATPKVRNDIVKLLGLDKDSLKWFHTPSARPNIHYEVKYVEEIDDDCTSADEERVHDLLTWLDTVRKRREARMNPDANGESNEPRPKLPPISGIIYVPLRSVADVLARILNKSGRNIRAVAYHAGLPASDRKRIQKMWASKTPPSTQLTGPCPYFSIVVATNAFGMGIDNPHVRFVIHWAPPRSFEGLVQESGRAGRDGRAAVSIIYYNRNERDRVLERVKADGRPERTSNRFAPQTAGAKKRSLEARLESFNKVIAFCESTDRCRHEIIREFSGDLELEILMSSQTTRSNQTSSSPCDFACDVCKYGTAEITQKKTEMLKASAELEAMGAYSADMHTFMYYWMTYFVRR